MSWLLDTHALIWALFEPPKLGRKTRDIIKDPANDVRVSPLSKDRALPFFKAHGLKSDW